MPCLRCLADPTRRVLGSTRVVERQCAFDANGKFTPDNWCCLTLDTLRGFAGQALFVERRSGLLILPCDPSADAGWIALTIHGWHNKVCSAVHLGDHSPRVLSLGVAQTTIAYWEARAATERAIDQARHELTQQTRQLVTDV